MRIPHIDRKRAAVGYVAFLLARRIAKRKVRRRVGAIARRAG